MLKPPTVSLAVPSRSSIAFSMHWIATAALSRMDAERSSKPRRTRSKPASRSLVTKGYSPFSRASHSASGSLFPAENPSERITGFLTRVWPCVL